MVLVCLWKCNRPQSLFFNLTVIRFSLPKIIVTGDSPMVAKKPRPGFFATCTTWTTPYIEIFNPLTTGNARVRTYSTVITDALVHQYPQCCLNISYIGPVSYRNITVRASSIRKWQYVQNWKISCYWLFHWQSLTWNLAIAIFIFRKPNHEEFKHIVNKGTTLQEKRYEIIRDVCLTIYIHGLMRRDSINPCLFTICSWRCTWWYLEFHAYQICWWPINLDVFLSSTEKRKQLFVAGKGTFILRSDFKKSVQLKTHQGWVNHCDAITRNPLFTGTGTRAGTHRIWRQSPAGTGTASRHARATQCASQLRQNSRQYRMRTCCMDKKHIHLSIQQVRA